VTAFFLQRNPRIRAIIRVSVHHMQVFCVDV